MSELVEVRALVRREMLDRVVHGLKEAGVHRLSVIRVHTIGAGVDPACVCFSLEETCEYADKALVIFVAPVELKPRFVDALIRAARTGRAGDGIVYVEPVLEVSNIGTGVTGAAALE